MATHYIDPIGGSDAANGLSFANRKRTLASIAGLAAGDSIRVIESRAPVSLGTIAWTDNSRSLTLNSALTLEIDPCTAAWTPVSPATSATSANRKFGSTSSTITLTTAFTTGKVAYKTLAGTVDASAYTSVSFWLRLQSGGTGAWGQAMTLRLCSDTTGDTVVASALIDFGQTAAPTAGEWMPIFLDFGGALPSNINSISLSTSVDLGSSPIINLNNMFACQNLAHADHLSLRSKIGKMSVGEPEWYPIGSINGTAVELLHRGISVPATGPAYRGVTESVTTYQLIPTFPNYTSAQRSLPTTAGTESAPVVTSYGWDATAMTTQSGLTAWTGMAYMGAAWLDNGDWHNHIGPLHIFDMSTAAYTLSSSADWNVVNIASIGGCSDINIGSTSGNSTVTIDRIVWNSGSVNTINTQAGCIFRAGRITGCTDTSAAALFMGHPGGFSGERNGDVWVDRIDNNTGAGVGAATGDNGFLRGCVLENNSLGDIRGEAGRMVLQNCSLLSTNAITVNPPAAVGRSAHASNCNGSSTDHRMWDGGWRAFTQTSVRETASGVAWQVQPTSTALVNSLRPAVFPLAQIACEANEQVDISVWGRRDSTSLNLGIRIRGASIPGQPTTLSDSLSGSINTWEEMTLSFTPTARGVVQVEAFFYGGTTLNGYYDSLTVTQA